MQPLNRQVLPAESSHNPVSDERLKHMQLRVWKPGDPQRSRAEAFIRDRFQDSYAAEVQSFMPYLLGVVDDHNEISAVIGFRPASNGDLFLENYLGNPAEQALSEACGSRVQRQQIVEVGNLASGDSESFRILMIGLVTLLNRLPGTNWIMCTVGERLFRLLQRTRFFPLVLEQANQQRLTPQQGKWGSYYRNPRSVVAGNVGYGLRELKRKNHWSPEFARQVNRLFENGLFV